MDKRPAEERNALDEGDNGRCWEVGEGVAARAAEARVGRLYRLIDDDEDDEDELDEEEEAG